jgi:DNA-binding transcriptional ArsR family regulator
MEKLDDHALAQVADYFQALAVPARLRILNALRSGPRNVGELTELTGCSQANASKHLGVLAQAGFVERAARGTSVYYRITDPAVYDLCDLVCGQIRKRYDGQVRLYRSFARAVPTSGSRRRGARR